MRKLISYCVLGAVMAMALPFSLVANANGYLFSDLIMGHDNYSAVMYLEAHDIVQGYDDGTFRPDNTINRAEFTKLLIEAAYYDEFEGYGDENCFDDVPAGEWYTKYVCFANDMDIVEGYDGGGFHPDAVINFAEASKIVVLAYDYDTQDDSPWYKPY
ncbi:S-layer homology domain-containing protein, partial [Candidatus Peregrinibacteria bacterium]|nr:S-layer homology domain-containing protein [Candidatus Peregrinibacteria bacterium]